MGLEPLSKKSMSRWSLRSLLLLMVPLCITFAWLGHLHRQREQAIAAYLLMLGKGGMISGLPLQDVKSSGWLCEFRNVTLTDADLDAFTPAFNGHAPAEYFEIEVLDLRGSRVSADAIQRFRSAVPQCTLKP